MCPPALQRGHNFEPCLEMLAGPSCTSSAMLLHSPQSLAILGHNLFSAPSSSCNICLQSKTSMEGTGKGFFFFFLPFKLYKPTMTACVTATD